MNWRHIPLFIIVTLLTYIIHEAGHWAMGEILGYDMWVNVNSAGLARGEYSAEWHRQLVTAAGPLITLTQAVIAFLIVRKRKSIIGFAFLFAALMIRFVAMVMSLNNPNDEARVSEWLGLGSWTLHVFVVAVLLGLTIKGSAYLKWKWHGYVLAYIAISLGLTAAVMSEGFIPRYDPYS